MFIFIIALFSVTACFNPVKSVTSIVLNKLYNIIFLSVSVVSDVLIYLLVLSVITLSEAPLATIILISDLSFSGVLFPSNVTVDASLNFIPHSTWFLLVIFFIVAVELLTSIPTELFLSVPSNFILSKIISLALYNNIADEV